jgi:hypothetical protein
MDVLILVVPFLHPVIRPTLHVLARSDLIREDQNMALCGFIALDLPTIDIVGALAFLVRTER